MEIIIQNHEISANTVFDLVSWFIVLIYINSSIGERVRRGTILFEKNKPIFNKELRFEAENMYTHIWLYI
jgi:hypothetical protein